MELANPTGNSVRISTPCSLKARILRVAKDQVLVPIRHWVSRLTENCKPVGPIETRQLGKNWSQ